jgi:hypothetical protein
MSGDSLNTSAPGESAPRESRTAQFYQATEPSEINARYRAAQWAKPPIDDGDDQEYREPRSWRDNPVYNRRR